MKEFIYVADLLIWPVDAVLVKVISAIDVSYRVGLPKMSQESQQAFRLVRCETAAGSIWSRCGRAGRVKDRTETSVALGTAVEFIDCIDRFMDTVHYRARTPRGEPYLRGNGGQNIARRIRVGKYDLARTDGDLREGRPS